MARCTVYGLVETDKPNVIRYVGQTKSDPERRFGFHIRASKRPKSRVEHWIASVHRVGGTIALKILDRNATWDVSEVLWIAKLRQSGHPLMNVLDGGQDTMADFRRRKKADRRKAIRARRNAILAKQLSRIAGGKEYLRERGL